MSDDDFDDEFEDEDDDDDVEDEVAGEGNRIVGGAALTLVEHVALALADDPDSVEVDLQERGGKEVAILVRVAPEDMGRLIGKRGRVVQALRQVTRAAGVAEGVKVTVDVVE